MLTRFYQPFDFLKTLDNVIDEMSEFNPTSLSNIIEDGSSVRIDMCLPGRNKEDVKVEVDDGYITISSTGEDKNREQKYVLKEFSISPFRRRFKISSNIDINSVRASFTNGILTVTVDKVKQKTSNRLIDIL